jgi:putative addiction module killer protein
MREIIATDVFLGWIGRLRDHQARAGLLARIDRLRYGNPGDLKRVAKGIAELRLHYGPGYRVYVTQYESRVVLLCGGDKSSQRADIEVARRIASQVRN